MVIPYILTCFAFTLSHHILDDIIKKWRGAGCFVFVYTFKIYCPLERWRASWQSFTIFAEFRVKQRKPRLQTSPLH